MVDNMTSNPTAKRYLPDAEIEPTLTVHRASQILGVSDRTLYSAISRGEFPCIRVRRRVLISTRYLVGLLSTGSKNE